MTSVTLDRALTNSARTAKDIAAAIGVTPACLSQWRTGAKPVPGDRRGQLERELRQSLDWTPASPVPLSGTAGLSAAVAAMGSLPPINLTLPSFTDRHVRAVAGGATLAAVGLAAFPKQPGVALCMGLAGAALGYLIPEAWKEEQDGETCPSCGAWFSLADLQNQPEDAFGRVACPRCGAW